MSKKFIVIIVATAFVGGIVGSVGTSNLAKANIFQDIYNSLFNQIHGLSQNATSSIASSVIQNAPAGKYESNNDYENAVMDSVEKVSPAVVSIIISKNVPIIEQCPESSPFANLPPEFQQFFGGQGLQFYTPCQKGTQLQEVGGGSGFIISSDGLIVTNKHVVSDAGASYTVLTNDGKKYDAKVLAQSPVLDLAVVKINATNLPTVTLRDSDGLRLGQTTIAIGNALGEFRNTVSVGVVSGLARTITASGDGLASETIEGVIQTSAAINPGNSGGPLLNLKGEVIGINVATVSGAQNVGFSIPINQVRQAINSVQKTGAISTPYIGVRYVLVDSGVQKDKKLSIDYGVLVQGDKNNVAVIKGSPADKAGIKSGDVIFEINGQKIDQDHSLSLLLQNYTVGDAVTLKVMRGTQQMDISVTLEQRPAGS